MLNLKRSGFNISGTCTQFAPRPPNQDADIMSIEFFRERRRYFLSASNVVYLEYFFTRRANTFSSSVHQKSSFQEPSDLTIKLFINPTWDWHSLKMSNDFDASHFFSFGICRCWTSVYFLIYCTWLFLRRGWMDSFWGRWVSSTPLCARGNSPAFLRSPALLP